MDELEEVKKARKELRQQHFREEQELKGKYLVEIKMLKKDLEMAREEIKEAKVCSCGCAWWLMYVSCACVCDDNYVVQHVGAQEERLNIDHEIQQHEQKVRDLEEQVRHYKEESEVFFFVWDS